MIKICINCGNEFNAKSNGAKYCDDCKNGKIYIRDHIGEKYDQLIVDKFFKNKDRYYAECTCFCGKKCIVRYDSLTREKTTSCGHKTQFQKKDMIGKVNKHGVKILQQMYGDKKNNTYNLKCLCNCGKEFFTTGNNFSRVKSCGCAYNQSRMINIKKASDEYDRYSHDKTNALHLNDKIYKSNTSGFRGVSFRKDRGKWVAQIVYKGKKYYLGSFLDKKDAIFSRKIAEEKLFGNFLKWFAEEYPILYKKIKKDEVDR